ncbi:Na+/H+ antiporter NhaA [Achromobacter aegrifaciens]|uniref:Na+/H+ antiporter NhaA n=1 Tax=Achromobacter aegrifaciens TaxID=1287736 RepID=UPI001AD7E87A|nr:Na+/H+ antiporter NhaA [Achromobacter aegrifaciens]
MSFQAVPPQKPVSFLQSFLRSEALGGYVLMLAALVALVVANSPAAPVYFSVLETKLGFQAGPVVLKETVLHWINDGLMAVFFLLVGLEIKREVLDGQLRGAARIVLPGIAALGGMALPALIYVLINFGSPDTLRGWAIPAATDIAFALGILALLGSRVPTSLKIFLTALAILDDLGAIVIIALFYTAELNVFALSMAGALLVCLFCLNRAGVLRLTPYLLIGAVLWYFVLKSGVHATLAGVALALTIPLRPQNQGHSGAHSPLHTLEHALHKPVALLIVPIFGFANAGVSFAGMGLGSLAAPVPLGVALGLFLGKQLGVFGFAWLAIKSGIATLPRHASYMQLYGVSLLCGIGFTMSLFIGALAFSDPAAIDATKIGVLTGSLASAVVGFLVLRACGTRAGAAENLDPGLKADGGR